MKTVLSFLFSLISTFFCFAQQDTVTGISKVYNLGEVVITESSGKSQVKAEEMEKYNTRDAANSLKILPSVVLSTFASRNESTIYVRGFDTRSVPVFIDGIPVYVPYDGYVDLARFTTYDIARIDVSSGFTPVSYGANTLGGSVNLVSMKPSHRFELGAGSGVMSGNGLESNVNIGSNRGKMYVQSGFSYLQRRYVPLSGHFTPVGGEPDRRLDNSGREDVRFSIKLGYVPGKKNEYSINYIYSHGSKGNPVYLGTDQLTRPRYWKWPYWDKQSIYYISKITVGNRSNLKVRAYFDSFRNKLSSYDDGTYSTQSKKSAFDSYYNDYTIGSSIELSNDITVNNHLVFSAQIKNDNHSEHNNNEPERHFADNTISAGAEDVLRLSPKMKLIPSVSYNIRMGLRAEDFDTENSTIIDYKSSNSRSLNAQLAGEYKLSQNSGLDAYIAWKSRFATMKDRFSYRLGTGLPNPDLKPEDAVNLGLSWKFQPSGTFSVKPGIFYSYLFNTIQLVNNVLDDLSQMQNTGESVFSGFDVAAGYRPLRMLDFYASYSLIKRKNISNPGILFTDIPEHKLFASAELRIIKIFDIILSGEYNSKRISSSDGTRKAPGYALGNARFSAGILKGLRAEAGVNNIFDKNYMMQEGYPEAGRNFYISVRFSLEK